MPYIQLNDTQFPLRIGAMRVGAAADADIRLPGAADPGAVAVVEVGADHSASIRRAHDAVVVFVNGVQLGVEPTPLLHGDRIEMAGQELLFGDDRKGGSTQYVPSMAAFSQGGAAAVDRRPGTPTAASGGLLRSLVDGREYPVSAVGLVIGRDAGCDVVVPSSEVSRRHAAIVPGDVGYELRDTSTNGVWLNGNRIAGQATLGRGDVVRIGNEEFRFYADAAAPSAAPAAPAPMAAPMAAPIAAPMMAPLPDVEMAVREPVATPRPEQAFAPAASRAPATPAASPAAGRAPTPDSPPRPAPAAPAVPPAAGAPGKGALAVLEGVNEGLLKGQRFEVRYPLAHVGRGDHNDVVIAEESVSDSHAKLQKRDARWFVVDMGSTNGTYVGGRRVEGEQELTAGADVRFGGVKLRFQPMAEGPDEGKGTRVIAGANLDAARRAGPAAAKQPAKRPVPAPAAPEKKSSPLLVVLLFVLVAAVAAYFIMGR
jgi:pSer/pThr/pTyr-binding forkhead associated (FHA) protein